MIVVVLERTPPSLRGLLTRWLFEVRAGVFVGTASARVREELWAAICASKRAGACLLLHSAPNEQGFELRSSGDTSRDVVDFDGLKLVRLPQRDGGEEPPF